MTEPAADVIIPEGAATGSSPGRDVRTMDCQNPSCTDDASEHYRDEHGNSVRVCERHYYRLVTGESGGTGLSLPVSDRTDRVRQSRPQSTGREDESFSLVPGQHRRR